MKTCRKDLKLDKYLVLRWDLLDKLSDEDLEAFYGMLSEMTDEEPEVDYYVVDAKEPYADKVKALMDNGSAKISRQELIRNLEELAQLKDIELAHEEADELLLSYVNDPDIESAYEEVPKWYA